MSALEKQMMPSSGKALRSRWIIAGVLSCFFACLGDLVVPVMLARAWPGYDPVVQSESILGAANSPVAGWFKLWSIALAMLFFIFARGLHHSFWPGTRAFGAAAWLLVLYGIGEGLGSGLFPFDHQGGALTLSGKIHSAFSILGSGALYLLPAAWLLRPPVNGPRLRGLSRAMLVLGLALVLLFSAAKAGHGNQAGLWQRAYLFAYYIYLFTLAYFMARKAMGTNQRTLTEDPPSPPRIVEVE